MFLLYVLEDLRKACVYIEDDFEFIMYLRTFDDM